MHVEQAWYECVNKEFTLSHITVKKLISLKILGHCFFGKFFVMSFLSYLLFSSVCWWTNFIKSLHPIRFFFGILFSYFGLQSHSIRHSKQFVIAMFVDLFIWCNDKLSHLQHNSSPLCSFLACSIFQVCRFVGIRSGRFAVTHFSSVNLCIFFASSEMYKKRLNSRHFSFTSTIPVLVIVEGSWDESESLFTQFSLLK